MSAPGRRKTDAEPGRRAIELGPIKSTRIYEEIVRQVKQLIAEGRLKSGDQLPPERDLAENALRQSLIMSQGSLSIFVTRPISGVITAVAIFFFVLPVLTPWWRRLHGTPQPSSGAA